MPAGLLGERDGAIQDGLVGREMRLDGDPNLGGRGRRGVEGERVHGEIRQMQTTLPEHRIPGHASVIGNRDPRPPVHGLDRGRTGGPPIGGIRLEGPVGDEVLAAGRGRGLPDARQAHNTGHRHHRCQRCTPTMHVSSVSPSERLACRHARAGSTAPLSTERESTNPVGVAEAGVGGPPVCSQRAQGERTLRQHTEHVEHAVDVDHAVDVEHSEYVEHTEHVNTPNAPNTLSTHQRVADALGGALVLDRVVGSVLDEGPRVVAQRAVVAGQVWRERAEGERDGLALAARVDQ